MPNRLTKANQEPRLTFTNEYSTVMYNRLQELEDMIESGQLVKLPAVEKVPYADIKDLYNNICKSLPSVTKLSTARKTAIKARFNEGYKLEDFEKVFKNAEDSGFLSGRISGSGGRYFHATFDWLINGNNMVKVIDGNYSNGKTEEHSYDLDKFEQMAYGIKNK